MASISKSYRKGDKVALNVTAEQMRLAAIRARIIARAKYRDANDRLNRMV